ncbi:MAG: hypothetical protein ACI9S7_000501 [Candidatus Paceibacteria bacterium]
MAYAKALGLEGYQDKSLLLLRLDLTANHLASRNFF